MSHNVITIDALIRAKARKEYLKELTELFKPVQAMITHPVIATNIEHKDGECRLTSPDLSGGVKNQRTLSTRQMMETVFGLTYNANVGEREQAAVDLFLKEFERLQAQVAET